MPTLNGLIFDMDGLMLDTERMATSCLKNAGKTIGLDFTDALLTSLIGLNEHSANLSIEKHLGKPIPRQALATAFYAEYAKAIETHGIPLKDGLMELLTWLEENHIRRAVATSTKTALALQKLESAGILSYFEYVIGGDKVQQGKPAPDPYLLAARSLGVPVDACLALEDSDHGAMSAYAAGMKVIVVPDIIPPSVKTRGIALRVFGSLHEVREYLQNSGFEQEKEVTP